MGKRPIYLDDTHRRYYPLHTSSEYIHVYVDRLQKLNENLINYIRNNSHKLHVVKELEREIRDIRQIINELHTKLILEQKARGLYK